MSSVGTGFSATGWLGKLKNSERQTVFFVVVVLHGICFFFLTIFLLIFLTFTRKEWIHNMVYRNQKQTNKQKQTKQTEQNQIPAQIRRNKKK